jgi:hypothetical protein
MWPLVWAELGLSIGAVIVTVGCLALMWRADRTVMFHERERQRRLERDRERRQQRKRERNDNTSSASNGEHIGNRADGN